jgi:hypothetical protein
VAFGFARYAEPRLLLNTIAYVLFIANRLPGTNNNVQIASRKATS